jgi:hypothetical protein
MQVTEVFPPPWNEPARFILARGFQWAMAASGAAFILIGLGTGFPQRSWY